MKLTFVETFLAVAEAGSIRSAADLIGKSQSALTKQLKQMEQELGLVIFQRTSKGVKPTEDGIILLSRARSIRSELNRFEQEASQLLGSQSGSLRVSAAPLAAVKILPRAISRFQIDFPQINIEISSDLFGDAVQSLRDGQDDLFIGPYADGHTSGDLRAEELFKIEMAVVTARDAPHSKAESLAELAECYWVMMGSSAGKPLKRFEAQFTRNGLAPPMIRLACESRLGLLALVEELGGVCTFPVPLLDELHPGHNIVRIPIAEKLQPLTISMVTRAEKRLTPAGEKLADCIRHRSAILAREWELKK